MRDVTLSAKDIFFEAIDLDCPEAVDQLLTQRCGEDSNLRSRVEGLLRAHGRAGNFLGGDGAADEQPELPQVIETVGTEIGPYKLREQIGEGGFGIVFVAEQTSPVRRMVALKVIKPGMDTRDVVARFEAERQAVALMDHPNIAKVFDGGSTDLGRPYFVMELVHGIPITEYCDELKLDTPGRLKLFRTVCQAVQHAHQKGIIHRDLKPSNVMVSLPDGIPKVIDFGVAKAINQRLSDQTFFTGQHEMIGTPAYMSPEQAELSGVDVDTRTDIYSLGVLLYELLTGAPPFDHETLKLAGVDEMRRILREDDPPRPSDRLSTLRERRLEKASTPQPYDHHRHARVLRGELDWIVMKAIEKDRDRRYESAGAFSLDIGRYLQGEPVEACPPSSTYHFRKLFQRHRAVVTTTLLVTLALLLGSVISIWQAIEANEARQEADTNFAASELHRGRAEANLQLAKDALTDARRQREIADDARQKAEAGQLRARQLLYASDMRQAIEAWRNYDLAVVSERLAAQVPQDGESDVRGFEWHFLNTASRRTPERTLIHDSPVTDCAVTPDGTTLVTAAEDGRLRFWNMSDGTLDHTLPAHVSAARSIAVSPDGTRLVSGGDDNLLQLWDMQARKSVKLPTMMKTGIESVAWSPDGRWYAAGSRYSEFGVWSANGEEVLRVNNDHRHEATVFSADGTRLYVATRSHIAVWNLETRTEETPLNTGALQNVRAMCLLRGGQYLAATERFDQRIAIFDCESRRLLTYLEGATDYVQHLAASPTGDRLASVAPDGMLRLFDISQPEVSQSAIKTVTRVHTAAASTVRFSDTAHIVTGGADGAVRVWRLDQLPNWSNHGPKTDLFSASFARDEGVIVTSLPRRNARPVRIHVKPGGQDSQAMQAAEFPARSGNAISQNRRWYAIGGTDGKVAVWDLDSGTITAHLRGLTSSVGQLAFSPNGNALAGWSDDGTIVIWQAQPDWLSDSPPPGHRFEVRDVRRMRFSPDGTRLAAMSPGLECIYIWDVASGQVSCQISEPVEGSGLAFHPDGSRIAAGCEDYQIRIWNTSDGSLASETGTLPLSVHAIRFTGDGHTLLSGHENGAIRLWHLPTSQSLGVLHEPIATGFHIREIDISPVNRQVIAVTSAREQALLLSNQGPITPKSEPPRTTGGR